MPLGPLGGGGGANRWNPFDTNSEEGRNRLQRLDLTPLLAVFLQLFVLLPLVTSCARLRRPTPHPSSSRAPRLCDVHSDCLSTQQASNHAKLVTSGVLLLSFSRSFSLLRMANEIA